ncbi:heme-binding protein [Prosthecochloris sp. N3]|uniref:Heme-binding protein n=1 Tax=Prosthecochloris ethylica TaxID=2743976 RepID=A0ABR9XTF9_9CHLB|nr:MULTISPECIES: heme-binding protein [Prosthecochloris]MBF0587235.1 heme-binding protein [Prosthecochloris ethylica]MBF0637308.1 heme-binding protein [Prosthecochloris ethylica]NUK48397.1 heme-binding protein [Prosthecochloris ethylica]RNA65599.1 heme-binding protein [Prosthecochloris sp. ZM_2]
MTSPVLVFTTVLLLTGCSVLGKRSAEEPPYTVREQSGAIEIRSYPSLIVAETVVEGDYRETSGKAFSRLAGYIFGRNSGEQKISMTAPVIQEPEGKKIPMTAPVLQEPEGDSWRMAFVMPEEYTMETLPRPLDKAVTIRELPPRLVATIRYTGMHSQRNIDKWSEKLKAWLDNEGYEQLSPPKAASYDPPWTIPMLRRNEIHIDVNDR